MTIYGFYNYNLKYFIIINKYFITLKILVSNFTIHWTALSRSTFIHTLSL